MTDFLPFDLGDSLNCSGSVAPSGATDDGFSDWGKGADFRAYQRERSKNPESVAVVVTVAGGEDYSLPWESGLKLLQTLLRPAHLNDDEWENLVWGAVRMSRDWGRKALDLGWHPLDLFGCHPQPTCRDGSLDGLVVCTAGMLSSLSMVDMTEEYAALSDLHGNILKYRRRQRPGQVFIWHAFASESGP